MLVLWGRAKMRRGFLRLPVTFWSDLGWEFIDECTARLVIPFGKGKDEIVLVLILRPN